MQWAHRGTPHPTSGEPSSPADCTRLPATYGHSPVPSATGGSPDPRPDADSHRSRGRSRRPRAPNGRASLSRSPRDERWYDQRPQAAEEWPPVSGKPLHHGDVGADQDQQYRQLLQGAIPLDLELPFQGRVSGGQPRELVEDEDHRSRSGRDGDTAQPFAPRGRRRLGQQSSVGNGPSRLADRQRRVLEVLTDRGAEYTGGEE